MASPGEVGTLQYGESPDGWTSLPSGLLGGSSSPSLLLAGSCSPSPVLAGFSSTPSPVLGRSTCFSPSIQGTLASVAPIISPSSSTSGLSFGFSPSFIKDESATKRVAPLRGDGERAGTPSVSFAFSPSVASDHQSAVTAAQSSPNGEAGVKQTMCLAASSTAVVNSPCSPNDGVNCNVRRMWRIEDFELGPRVGRGNFGYVQLGRDKKHGTIAALKVLKKRRLERLKVQRHVTREIEIQGHLRHDNILRLFGFFWDSARIYLILEYALGGDLARLLKKQPSQCFSEAGVASIVAQALSAVVYCHQMHVIHRDLKPENFLVSSSKKLKLTDFGWAVHTYPDERRWTLCGTLDYLPPEMVHATQGHSFGVDVWGLGVLFYELLVGRPPFSAPTQSETYRRILEAVPCYPEGTSAGATELMRRMLRREPSERINLGEATLHPWFRQYDCAGGEGCLAALAGA